MSTPFIPSRIQPIRLPRRPTRPLLQHIPPPPQPSHPPLPRLRRPRRHPLPRLRHPRTTRRSHIPSLEAPHPPPLLVLPCNKWHANHLKWRASKLASQKVKTTFYAIFLPMPDYIRWLDSVCGTGIFDSFGWFKWRAWKLWWQDRKMYATYKKGLLSPAIWRCFDMGYGRKVWEGAKERVLRDNELAELGRERRLRYVEEQRRKGVKGHVVGPIVVGW